jgi:hypothetical protein
VDCVCSSSYIRVIKNILLVFVLHVGAILVARLYLRVKGDIVSGNSQYRERFNSLKPALSALNMWARANKLLADCGKESEDKICILFENAVKHNKVPAVVNALEDSWEIYLRSISSPVKRGVELWHLIDVIYAEFFPLPSGLKEHKIKGPSLESMQSSAVLLG